MSRTVLAWSGGKDSALALDALRGKGVEPHALLTTLVEETGRVSTHGVRHELIERQARAVGLPLVTMAIPWPCPNEVYEARLAAVLGSDGLAGVDTVAFGDLFLADIRAYREELMSRLGRRAVFPTWRSDTAALAREFIAVGFEATVVAVDAERLDSSFVGRPFDHALLRDLPPDVDPCGENGEFHTFVHAGPVFAEPLPRFAG